MLEKMRKNSFPAKYSAFHSWYSACVWIGWWWSRRCLLWKYFSSCVADIMEQHGPTGSFDLMHRALQVSLLISAPGDQRFIWFNSCPCCWCPHLQMMLRARAGAFVAVGVCVWVAQGSQELGTHMFIHTCLPGISRAAASLHQSSQNWSLSRCKS